jgi:GNAT superfamily N-acetyltransferase
MLQRMVVVPQLQGQGVGSRALRSILSSESSNPSSTTSAWHPSIHLDTQEESNVRFYEKLGWTVTSSRDFYPEDVDYKFHSWQMVHSGGNTSRCE